MGNLEIPIKFVDQVIFIFDISGGGILNTPFLREILCMDVV